MKNGRRVLGWTAAGLIAAAVWFAGDPGVVSAAEDQTVSLYVDGEKSGQAVRIINKSSYLPLDAVELLGGTLKADTDGNTYTITSGRKEVRFTIDEKQRFVDGAPVAGDEAAVRVKNGIYVPVGWVVETLNAKVVQDRFTSSVYVFRPQSGGGGKVASPGSSVPSGNTNANVNTNANPNAPVPSGATSNGTQQTRPNNANHENNNSGLPSDVPVTVTDALPTLDDIVLDGDVLSIATSGDVLPNVFRLKAPDRLVVDLPEATVERAADGTASGSIAVDPGHPYISGIRYSLFAIEPSTVRIVIDLKSPKSYIIEPNPSGPGALIRFVDMKPIQVMIDAGHGGSDPGAISLSGKHEKDVTLPIALKVMERLEKETLIEPVMVRKDDTYSSPGERAALANSAGVDLYVSIHANTASSQSVQGTETYYWRDDSRAFAEVIHQEMLQAIGSPDRKVKQARYVVVRDTTMPAVLLELGFLTNASDEAKLYNEQMQDRIADAIVRAIKSYYSIT